MPLPLLASLPATARAAYPFVQAGVARGLSSRAIERIVRQAGLPISRSRSILPMMRELQELQRVGAAVRFIPKAATVNVLRLPNSLTHIRRNFSFNVRVRGVDSFGSLIERHVTVATDRMTITPGEIEEAAQQMVSEEGQSATLRDVDVTLQYGMRRADFPA